MLKNDYVMLRVNVWVLCSNTSLPLEGDNSCLLILILSLCGPQHLPSLEGDNGEH